MKKHKHTFLFKVARYLAIQIYCPKRQEPEMWQVDWIYDGWDSNPKQMLVDIDIYKDSLKRSNRKWR
jgi:hypothetical protein